jgi:hypothetical protein
MRVEGSLEKILTSTLPHEITHAILADHFRCPVPRWADEGVAVLSESEAERKRHDMLAGQILTTKRAIPLSRLLALTSYPPDVMAMYAQGYSLTHFLVEAKDRPTFLAFVADGMKSDWDRAVRKRYAYKDVAALEAAWLKKVRGKPDVPRGLARGKATGEPAGRGKPYASARRGEDSEELIPGLIRALGDKDEQVASNVIETLTLLGKEAVPALVRALGSEDKKVRSLAALVLGKLGVDAAPAVPALTRLLKDADVEVRRAASRAILDIVQAKNGPRSTLPATGGPRTPS